MKHSWNDDNKILEVVDRFPNTMGLRGVKVFINSIIVILVLSSCSKSSINLNEYIEDSQYTIGTIVSIRLYGTEDEALLSECFQIIDDIDQMMSLNVENSLINQLNALQGGTYKDVPEDMLTVINTAIQYGDLSDGGFDITMEPVIDLWGIGTEKAAIPDGSLLKEALAKVDYHQIIIDMGKGSVMLPANITIDLGGIGKGFAADKVADFLREKGISKAILNLGGNVLVLGGKTDTTGFRVGVQDPYGQTNEYFGVVELVDQTLVTSGIYERNFSEDGVLYHHILDTTSGYPVDNNVAGISIITDKSIDADALSTILFIKGIEEGLALTESLEGVECLFVSKEKEVYKSSGMSIEIVNAEYTLKD